MYIIRPSYKHFVLQNILISAFFVISIITFFALLKKYSIFILFVNILIFLIYFFIMFVYRPLKFKNTVYSLSSSSILISTGIIFKRKMYIPYSAVKYVAKKRNIFQKISKTKSIVFYLTGGSIAIKNINLNELTDLKVIAYKEVTDEK